MAIILDIMDRHAENNIDILAILTKVKLCINAISDTNIDIVNPIPAIRDTKNTAVQLIFDGFSVIFKEHPIKLKSIIPRGFPIHRPSTIPYTNEFADDISILYINEMPVFAKANSGIIIKLFIGTKIRCNFSRVLVPELLSDGIAIASKTPLMVQ